MHWNTIYVVVFVSPAYLHDISIAVSLSQYTMICQKTRKNGFTQWNMLPQFQNFDQKMKEFSKYLSKAKFLNLFLLNGAAIIKGLLTTYTYILS